MSSTPDLSVVVPVFNAAAHLEALVGSLLDIQGVSVEIILVDDASSDASAETMRRLAAQHAAVVTLFHKTNQGAGVARNNGFAVVRGTYTLFFDADDHINADVVAPTLKLLDDTGCDLAMFSYRYERAANAAHIAMNLNDENIWNAYVGSAPYVRGLLSDYPRLLGFTNYPWNKIIRTETYKASGLKYGGTKVNNDILGHWHSLLFAGKLLMVNSVICTHVVHVDGGNLTNQHSEVRLQLLDALNETYDLLCSNPVLRQRYTHHYWDLVIRTAGWARQRIAPEFAESFKHGLRDLVARIDLGDFGVMKLRRSPALAQSLSKILLS